MKNTLARAAAILLLTLWASALLAAEQYPRPEKWAKPVSSKHLNNFYKLNDKVYRSAQPDRKAFLELEKLGIRNVLSFRSYHADNDKAKGTSIKLYRVKMEADEITDDEVIEALIIIKEADGPILIHCFYGSDRAGLISAMYRIVFQGWPKQDAIDELLHGGYGYHSFYKNIPEFIEKADIPAIRYRVMAP